MENLPLKKIKKNEIDYDNEGDQDWITYLDQNIAHQESKDVPFPDSSWSYATHDSHFDEEDALKRKDENLKQHVLNALYLHEEIDASQIEIEVVSGNVLLSGKVPQESMKLKTTELINKLKGVWSVTNKLVTQSQ